MGALLCPLLPSTAKIAFQKGLLAWGRPLHRPYNDIYMAMGGNIQRCGLKRFVSIPISML